MTKAYYNENDSFAAAWLRRLIEAGHIAHGDVDERSIKDVTGGDVSGYSQCHYFAGIGGWSYALRLADWPDDRPVWTGSCPCQPFSAAGKGLGIEDPRHLWPDFARLIGECKPPTVFGEQVGHTRGLSWFDQVANDLEKDNYAVGSAELTSRLFGGWHKRNRLYWVADIGRERGQGPLSYEHISQARSRRKSCEENMQQIFTEPFRRSCSIPQPLLRCEDDEFSRGVAALKGLGNAIDPDVATEFIAAFSETKE